jgi:PAS domain S-box-containing protein
MRRFALKFDQLKRDYGDAKMSTAKTKPDPVRISEFTGPEEDKAESTASLRSKIDLAHVEKVGLEIFLLSLGMMLILTLSLALLMVPIIFWQRSPEVLEDVWRKGFYGFLALSLLFDFYLIQRQMTLRKLRLQLAEQRSDQEILKTAKKMDEALLRSIGEGVFAVDSQERLILVNQLAEEWSGIQGRQAIRKPYREVLHFENLTVENFVEQAMKTKEGVQVDRGASLIRPDGSRMSVSILASPVLDEDEVRGCIVVFRDTTEQRALYQMKTDFVSIASHQLRTPLTGLRWYSSTLAEGQAGALNPEQQELLKEIERCVDRMVVLVDNLLDVARLDQGTLQLDLVPVSLAELLADAVRSLEPKAQNFNVSLTVDDGIASLPTVRADKLRLTEVIHNLVDNAIRYTPEQGTVKVMARQEGKEIIISISDTGVGIPEAERPRLFKKFSRIENPLSNRERGSGLGLYFAKGVVEKHGGKISLRSGVGKGSTFYVSLPL